MTTRTVLRTALVGMFLAGAVALSAGTLTGFVRDQNWYAHYLSSPYGVGYYEFAVNANGDTLSSLGGAAVTDVFGKFLMPGLPAGKYTVASWDVWWRSAYAFNVAVPASGSSSSVDLRLKATMWGYPAFWDDRGYYEFGQTFVATGPIAMVYLRLPDFANAPRYTLTVHEDGPGGRQVGVARSFGTGDQRPIYGYGEMPTVAGRTYYTRIRTSSPDVNGVIMQMDPRPDFSDPMPGGCLYLGTSSGVTAFPERDLGLVIMSDDDGLITNLFARQSGSATFTAGSIGQSFIARGVNLISVAVWLADPAAPTYLVRVLTGGPGGAPVGTAKRGKPARVTADPEMIVTWAPGECPLTPGQTYYLEITRSDGGAVNAAMVNPTNPFPYGQAYRSGVAVPGTDLAGTIMEEETPGSATKPTVQITTGPTVTEDDRGTNRLTIRWTTDVPAGSRVEYAAENPPYTESAAEPRLTTDHAITVSGLRPHAMYHLRVQSAAAGLRRAVSRDFVICTRADQPNLLANPGFEEGTGASPRKSFPGWKRGGGVDLGASDGTWFWGLKPHSGQWLLEGAVNGSSSDGYVYQRVAVTSGKSYTFSAWLTTWARENDTWKYDVWKNQGRLIYLRLGLDPTGGTNPSAATVQWTPRMYSHLRFTNLAKTAPAQSDFVTVFISMKGEGVQWHLYGVDDCVLTETSATPPRLAAPTILPTGKFQMVLHGAPGGASIIEGSSDLKDWWPLTILPNPTGAAAFTDGEAPNFSRRFYRAVLP